MSIEPFNPILIQADLERGEIDCNKTTRLAIENFQSSSLEAINLGLNPGIDFEFLKERGYQITICSEGNKVFKQFQEKKINTNNIEFVGASFEEVFLSPCDLFNASYCLPFYTDEKFTCVMGKIHNAIKRGGRFAGHFFGPESKCPSEVLIHTREEIEAFFPKNLYIIERCFSEIKITKSGNETFKWEVYHVVAKRL